MVAKLSAVEPLEPKDLEAFLDFKTQWQNRTLQPDHVVWAKVRLWAKRISHNYKTPDYAEDLEQSGLMALAKCDYKGMAKLETFISKTLLHENTRLWRRRGGKLRSEFPEDLLDPASQEIFNACLTRISEERLVAKLMKTDSRVQRRVIFILVTVEQAIGRQRMADLVSQELNMEVTRHDIEVILKRLRFIFGNRTQTRH